MKFNCASARDVDEDDEEHRFGLHDDEEDQHDAISVCLHSGKRSILNREQLAGMMQKAKQVILQRNSGPIRGQTNLLIESVGDVRFKVVNKANKVQ